MDPSPGTVLYSGLVFVDVWSPKIIHRFGVQKRRFFFLTHLHSDHVKGLSSWLRTQRESVLYTSEINSKLLDLSFPGAKNRVKVLPKNETISLKMEENSELNVTLLEANHIAGACMFLFESPKFGTDLVTGDFRFERNENSDFEKSIKILKMATIDRIFLDNTYLHSEYEFPTRKTMTERIAWFLEKYWSDSHIYIGMNKVGKEEFLVNLASKLKEPICVSEEKSKQMKIAGFDTRFITTSFKLSRIFTIPIRTLTKRFLEEKSNKSVGILPTALYTNWTDGPYSSSQMYNLFVFEYSDHSSYSELLDFVKILNPKKVIPLSTRIDGLMKERPGFDESRINMEVFHQFLHRDSEEENSPRLDMVESPKSAKSSPLKRAVSKAEFKGQRGVQYLTSSSSNSDKSQEKQNRFDFSSNNFVRNKSDHNFIADSLENLTRDCQKILDDENGGLDSVEIHEKLLRVRKSVDALLNL